MFCLRPPLLRLGSTAGRHSPNALTRGALRTHCATVPASLIHLTSTSPTATDALAELLASVSRPGDVFLLAGDVGAGKSHFSRAFIRAAMDEPELAVPSPTYLLQNTYESSTGRLYHHFDLYRLTTPASLARLDLPHAFANGVCLVEWPERLGALAPADAISLHIALPDGEAGTGARRVSLAFPRRDPERWEPVGHCLQTLGHQAGLELC